MGGAGDDYLFVLKALNELPFNVGKKLLTEFLQGKESHKTIKKHNLHKLNNFGSLAYSSDELTPIITRLIHKNFIELKSIKGNNFWKVLNLTKKGREEISNPTLNKKTSIISNEHKETVITDQERILFKNLPFLEKFNDGQKKAIICPKEKILCIAGAGSGKTTVLTQRISYLTRYKSIKEENILAITFTKKARQEMMHRIGNPLVKIETFNSFCEKTLQKYNHLLYDKVFRVITYKDRIIFFRRALSKLGLNPQRAVNAYFTFQQRRGKPEEKLLNIFMNDIFLLRNSFRARNLEINPENFEYEKEHERTFKMLCQICNIINELMKDNGLRDFSDQLIETKRLFKLHPELIPKYDHVLIDEYQDINASQIELIDQLSPENFFCVGDPRQSIYGWRGSDIKYILNFEDKYPQAQIINLTINYRSSKSIVDLCNSSIRDLGFPDLKSHQELKGSTDSNDLTNAPTNQTLGSIQSSETKSPSLTPKAHLLKHKNQKEEFQFVLNKIISSDTNLEEIFILARTNRILKDFSDILRKNKIKHVLRNDDAPKQQVTKNKLMLATVHAIKGLEAKMVFVINCTSNSFPCKGSDHPIMDIVKDKDYDQEEEEKRVLYVALSRAKEELYITYAKSPTYFFTEEMINLTNTQLKAPIRFKKVNSLSNSNRFSNTSTMSSQIVTNASRLSNAKSSSTRNRFTKINTNYKNTLRNKVPRGSLAVISSINEPIDERTLSKLRSWRYKTSKQESLPAYRIMHNKTLDELSQKKPTTISQLHSIYGLGKAKVENYGEEILKVIHG